MRGDMNYFANRVSVASNGKFFVLWRGRTVYTPDGEVSYFTTEHDAWAFLTQCDAAGRVID
jgi:hypothetical protein